MLRPDVTGFIKFFGLDQKVFGSNSNSGMIRINPDCFGMNFNPKLLLGFSDLFEIIPNGLETDFRITRKSSDSLGLNSNPNLSPGKAVDQPDHVTISLQNFMQDNFFNLQNIFLNNKET